MIRRFAFINRFVGETRASASVEFALLLPMLIVLLFGGAEAGHFVWTQHKLVEAVRDGARYASRLPVTGSEGVCAGATETISTAQIDAVKLVTRTGQLDNPGALPVVKGWDASEVSVNVTCQAFVDTGIYSDLGEAGPVVTVSASGVAYPMLFGGLAWAASGVNLTAKSSAVVIGI